jgi:hypothetical protein
MSIEERQQLFFTKYKKGISNLSCSEVCKCSPALISQFFKHGISMANWREEKLKKFIDEY